MIDIRDLKTKRDEIAKNIANRNMKVDVDEVILLNDKRAALMREVENLRAKRNENALKMKSKMDNSERQILIAEGKELKEKISVLETELESVENNFFEKFKQIPNYAHPEAPVGKEDKDSTAITVAVACAMAGMIAGCITVTGLASVLINAIVSIAGDATIIGLVLTMICCIVLGMGVPTTANYCIMASTCAPILVQLGFPPVAAHFFVFYFGIVADITPPVALAAYAGSAIAKSNPMKTGLNATKLAIAAFIVPYIFAYNPSLILEGDITAFEIFQIAASSLIGIFAIAAALNGFLRGKLKGFLRVTLIAGGLCMMIPGTLSDLIGLCLVCAVIIFQKVFSSRKSTC